MLNNNTFLFPVRTRTISAADYKRKFYSRK